MAFIELVDVQSTFSGEEQYGNEIDCSHLEEDDFLVIGFQSVVSGGGHIFYNKFSADATRYGHIAGMFGDSTDIFGYVDASMQSSGFASVFFRHKVTAANLVDTGGGKGTLTHIGWQKGIVPSYYPASMTMWTFRGATFSSKTGDGDSDPALMASDPVTLTLTGGGTLTSHQAWFSMGESISNGYNNPPGPYSHTVTDDHPTDTHFTQVLGGDDDWLANIPFGVHMGVAYVHNYAYGEGLDVEETNYTMSAGGDTTTSADATFVVVTFAEEFPPPVLPSEVSANVPNAHWRSTQLPYEITRTMLRKGVRR
jgi:hypothetical protein